jgi:hypothetical protein
MKSKKHSRRFEGVVAVVASTLILMGTAQVGDKSRIHHHFLAKPAFSPVAALVADSAGRRNMPVWLGPWLHQPRGLWGRFQAQQRFRQRVDLGHSHRFTGGNDGALPHCPTGV